MYLTQPICTHSDAREWLEEVIIVMPFKIRTRNVEKLNISSASLSIKFALENDGEGRVWKKGTDFC